MRTAILRRSENTYMGAILRRFEAPLITGRHLGQVKSPASASRHLGRVIKRRHLDPALAWLGFRFRVEGRAASSGG